MERLGDEVRRALDAFGPAAGMAELVATWPGTLGKAIAHNAWPARLARDGTLHVHTRSSAWAFELAQLEREIQERLRMALGEATPARLSFAVGPVPDHPPAGVEERLEPPPSPGEQERAAAAELTRSLGDEELRNLVARAAAASLARGRSSRSFW
jgi:hypothetical protein